jgi:putative DNA primase/helicase
MWQRCDKGEEMQAAVAVAGLLLDLGKVLLNTEQDKGARLIKHAARSHDLPKIEAMLKLAATEPGMTVGIQELDQDAWLLGVRNGVVDLGTGGLLVNQPSMLITKQCNASYDRTAQCPKWLAFLDQVFGGDAETIETMQRALGYTLTGEVTEEKLFICFGYGSNGKSVFGNVVSTMLGDYGRMAPSSLLTARRADDASPRNDLAALAGARYVSINELQAGDRLDEQTVKLLAGREPISARFLHKEFFTYNPTFTPWLRTNHKPIITGDDDGIWRRLVMIPFRRRFTDEEKDPFLESKLLAERDGILAWMVEGALKWKKDSLKLSPTIRQEVATYRKDSDLLGEFLDECCVADPKTRIEQSTLYSRFRDWCDVNGVRSVTKATFTRRLKEREYVEAKSNGKRFYAGLCLEGQCTHVPALR